MAEPQAPPAPTDLSDLTDLQRRFIDEYPIDCNGTQAAIRAGYSDNPVSAATEASRLLRNAKIRAAIDERLDQYSMSSAEILARMTAQARGDSPVRWRKAKASDTEITDLEFATEKSLDQLAKARGIYEGDDSLLGKILVVRTVEELKRELGEKEGA